MKEEEKNEEAREKNEAKKEAAAPIEKICADSEKMAEELVDDDSEIEPTKGYFFTSQRWH